MSALRLLSMLLLALLLPAPGIAADESDEAALARVRTEIVKMIGEAPCRNLVHCRLLPLGMTSCGVPKEYLAYSSGFMDVTALETRASEYAFLLDEIQGKQSQAIPCGTHREPQAVCIDNRCRVQPGK